MFHEKIIMREQPILSLSLRLLLSVSGEHLWKGIFPRACPFPVFPLTHLVSVSVATPPSKHKKLGAKPGGREWSGHFLRLRVSGWPNLMIAKLMRAREEAREGLNLGPGAGDSVVGNSKLQRPGYRGGGTQVG